MRIFNRAHLPWFVFVCVATALAGVLYLENFYPDRLPASVRLPDWLRQKPSDHATVGGTPLGLVFGASAFAIFIFAALLSLRKKVPLWRIGNVQRWLRAHIWLTLLTLPLVLFHSGFRLGGPMTSLLMAFYVIVMVSGVYGLLLQHQMPAMMKERLPAETVFEQIPHIRAQLLAAAIKLRDSFKPAPPVKTDAGAPAPSAAKAVTAGSTPMASTAAELSTPTARAKTVVGSTITAAPVAPIVSAPFAANSAATPPATPPTVAEPRPVAAPLAAVTPQAAAPEEARIAPPPPEKPGETMGTATARVLEGKPVPAGTESAPEPAPKEITTVTPAKERVILPSTPPPGLAKPSAPPAPTPVASTISPAGPPAAEHDPDSEAVLLEFLDRQVIPYLSAKRGEKFRLGQQRFAEDTIRFVRLRVAEAYRARVEEVEAWCSERRMLDLQTRLQHWLHGWLFVHVPFSFLLIMLTAWHAFVTLFYY